MFHAGIIANFGGDNLFLVRAMAGFSLPTSKNAWSCARPDSRGRLSPHEYRRTERQPTNVPCLIHSKVEYTAGKFRNPFGESAIMALEAAEQVTEQVPADDFQALEEKIYRTIERYKAARQAQAVAERDAQRVRQQLEERDEQLVTLRRETVQLRKEREEIRGRVEKMLEQIESIAEERAS